MSVPMVPAVDLGRDDDLPPGDRRLRGATPEQRERGQRALTDPCQMSLGSPEFGREGGR